MAIWVSWILPTVPVDILNRAATAAKMSLENFRRVPEYAARFALCVASGGIFITLFALPVTISKVGPRPSNNQTGIIVKVTIS